MNRTDSNHALQTDLFEDRLALSMPPAAAIEATDVETLANVIEILGDLERRLNRCRETTLLRSALGILSIFEADRAAAS